MDKIKHIKSATVVSNKSEKMLIAQVKRLKNHPLYKKQMTLTKKYHVYCQNPADYQIGDEIKIVQCKPHSKTITWEVLAEKPAVSKEK